MFPQQLPTVAVASSLKLSAGYTEDSSVITSQLWCLLSVLFQKGTVTHSELPDGLRFWGIRHILQSHWYLTGLYNPLHKAALFVWFCFNTPLSAQLASLGNVSHHCPPDPGFKIASYPQINTQEGISKKRRRKKIMTRDSNAWKVKYGSLIIFLLGCMDWQCFKQIKASPILLSAGGDYWKCWLGLHLINEAALFLTLQSAWVWQVFCE